MSNVIHLKTPLTDDDVVNLRIGDRVSISGIIYTARDAAHKRLVELIDEGKELPFDIRNQIIYYVGPIPSATRNAYCLWSYHEMPHGRVYTKVAGKRHEGYHWQG